MRHPVTPDGCYPVAKGELWRCTDPRLSPEERAFWVRELMRARRAVREARCRGDGKALEAGREAVDRAGGAGDALVGRGPGPDGPVGGGHPLPGRVA